MYVYLTLTLLHAGLTGAASKAASHMQDKDSQDDDKCGRGGAARRANIC